MAVYAAVASVFIFIAAYLLWAYIFGRKGGKPSASILLCLLIEAFISNDLYLALRIFTEYGDTEFLKLFLIPVSSLLALFVLIPAAIRNARKEPVLPEVHVLVESFLIIAVLNFMCLEVLRDSISGFTSLSFASLGLLSTMIVIYTPYVSTVRYNAKIKKIDEKLSAAQNAHYESVIQSNFEMRRVRHDMKDHLLAIRNLADKERKDELITYVDSILSDIGSAAPPYRTGNDTADVIIADKKAKARKRGLDLTVSGDIVGVDIESADIVTILSNLLDNAIEAVCRLYGAELDPEQKTIELEFKKNSNFLVIVEKNISGQSIAKDMIRSSKDSPDHGFGVYNIRKTVKKYGGEFNSDCERIGDKELYMVEVELMLPMKAD